MNCFSFKIKKTKILIFFCFFAFFKKNFYSIFEIKKKPRKIPAKTAEEKQRNFHEKEHFEQNKTRY